VQRIVLRMPDAFDFRAGQYLEVVHPDGAIPLSIASAPERLPQLHLHYRSTPDLDDATRMDALLEAGGPLEIRGPGGDVALPRPLGGHALIAAGGTGIAQAMSFIDAWHFVPPTGTVTLLWCADAETDFYLRDELDALDAPWLERVLIADDDRAATNRGLVWLRDRAAGLAGSHVVLAGGPGFVYAAFDALVGAGIEPAQVQSDVFSYAPR